MKCWWGLAAAAFLLEIGRLLFSRRRTPWWTRPVRWTIHSVAFLGVASLGFAYLIAPFLFEVVRIDIPSDKLARADVTIVQLSDIHCDRTMFSEPVLARVVNGLHPDLIVFTGDAVTDGSGVAAANKVFSMLQARLGKFAVAGNHDVPFTGAGGLFAGTGFRVLDEESVSLSKDADTVTISGLSAEAGDRTESLLTRVNKEGFSIFLYHYPFLAERVAESGRVDLYLAGHTHGGALERPLDRAWYHWTHSTLPYVSGSYRLGPMLLYVSKKSMLRSFRSAPPVRFWTRPVISVFRIHPSKKP